MQYFPNIWKKARVIPVPKPGKPTNLPTSYRPISLLSCLSKIVEKVLKNKILKLVENLDIFPNEQFGFRARHSTAHQILRVSEHVKNNRSLGKSTGLVLLDIEKAFDSVWHDGLVHKLVIYGFPLYIVKIVQSFLSGRCFSVFVNNCSSNCYQVEAGVPQGSVLGPVLYNIYTSDIPKLQECEIAIFADDTGIFSSHEFGLNIETNLSHAIEKMIQYYHKWKIKLNADKIQAIFFSRKRKSCYLPTNQLNLNGFDISWERSIKYLGVYLDQKLTFKEHIMQTQRKVSIAINMLYPFINKKSGLSHENKIIIHKVVFQAILLYGCQVWGNCAKCHLHKLQVSQNKLLKMMLNLPRYHSTFDLHARAGVEMISARIEKLQTSFLEKCAISDNPLIRQLVS